jgi:hypothetical protein
VALLEVKPPPGSRICLKVKGSVGTPKEALDIIVLKVEAAGVVIGTFTKHPGGRPTT